MKKKILLTGSEGFLGKNFCKMYANKYRFYNYDTKINKDITKIKNFPDVDYVIHLAAFNSTKNFYTDPLKVIYSNILPTISIISAYKKKKKKPLIIYAGTPEATVGASEISKKFKITDENTPLVVKDINNPRWSYAGSKIACEQIVKFSKLNYIIIRPHNVYGKYQKNHFIPEFINRCKRNDFKIYGWNNKRCWLYVDDFCTALDAIICSKKTKNQIINIASNFERTTLQIAKIITKELFGIKKINIKKLKAPKGSAKRRFPNIGKIKKILKWKPTTLPEVGLKKMLNEK